VKGTVTASAIGYSSQGETLPRPAPGQAISSRSGSMPHLIARDLPRLSLTNRMRVIDLEAGAREMVRADCTIS